MGCGASSASTDVLDVAAQEPPKFVAPPVTIAVVPAKAKKKEKRVAKAAAAAPVRATKPRRAEPPAADPSGAAQFAEWSDTLPSLDAFLDAGASAATLSAAVAGVVKALDSMVSSCGTLPYGVGPLIVTTHAAMATVQKSGMGDSHCQALALEVHLVVELFHGLRTKDADAFEQCKLRDFSESQHMVRLNKGMTSAAGLVKDYTVAATGARALPFSSPWGAKFRAAIDELGLARAGVCEYILVSFLLNAPSKAGVTAQKLSVAVGYAPGKSGPTAKVLRKLKAPVAEVPRDGLCFGWVVPVGGGAGGGAESPHWCTKRCNLTGGIFRAVAGTEAGGFYYVCGEHDNLDLDQV